MLEFNPRSELGERCIAVLLERDLRKQAGEAKLSEFLCLEQVIHWYWRLEPWPRDWDLYVGECYEWYALHKHNLSPRRVLLD